MVQLKPQTALSTTTENPIFCDSCGHVLPQAAIYHTNMEWILLPPDGVRYDSVCLGMYALVILSTYGKLAGAVINTIDQMQAV